MKIKLKVTLIFAVLVTCVQCAFSNNAMNNELFVPNIQLNEQLAIAKAQLPGDLDGDGSRSLYDIMLMVDIILTDDLNDIPLSAADLDNSGDVSLADIMILVDIILNGDKSTVFDVDGGKNTGIGYGGPGTGNARTNQNNMWDE